LESNNSELEKPHGLAPEAHQGLWRPLSPLLARARAAKKAASSRDYFGFPESTMPEWHQSDQTVVTSSKSGMTSQHQNIASFMTESLPPPSDETVMPSHLGTPPALMTDFMPFGSNPSYEGASSTWMGDWLGF
jgi:hypothetical protein